MSQAVTMHDERDLPWLAPHLAWIRDEWRGHALILQGPVGAGLLPLALRATQAWLCERPPGPCGQCAACHLSLARTHPDLRLVLPEATQLALGWQDSEEAGEGSGKRKPSKDIRVEQVRQAIQWAHTSSTRGRAKAMLLYPADAMNEVAANALLKTLEEPAAGVRLLLCVENASHLLPTIRSRCQLHRLPPPSANDAQAWLATQKVADAALLLGAGDGGPLTALELIAHGLTAERWRDLPGLLARGQVQALAELPVPLMLRVLQQICHDAMACLAGGPPRFFPAESMPGAPEPARRAARWEALLAWRDALWRTTRHADHPWQAPLLLDALTAQGRHALTLGVGATRPSARARG